MRGGHRKAQGKRGESDSTKRGNSGAPLGFSSHSASSSPSPPPASTASSSSRVDAALFRPTKALTAASSSPTADVHGALPTISAAHLSTYPIEFLPFLPDISTPSSPSPSSLSLLLRCASADLSTLLALPASPFLSHLHLNTSLHLFLSSFLHHLHAHPPSSADYAPVTRLVFVAFHRLTSTPGAALASLPAGVAGVALLMDFAWVYGAANGELCSAVVSRLVAVVPLVMAGLSGVMDGLVAALSSVSSTLALPVPLPLLTSSMAFVEDCYVTLLSFVLAASSSSVYPLMLRPPFLAVSARLYERVTAMIGEGRGGVEEMRELRRVMMALLHRCVEQCWVQPILRESGDVAATCRAFAAWVEDLTTSAPALLAHYTQLHGLAKTLSSMAALPSVKPHLPATLSAKLPAPPSAIPTPTPSLLRSTSTQQREDEAVQQVWSMLEGEVSEDFARAVLREYDGDVGRAVDAIFSGGLPPRLEAVSRDKRREWKDALGGEQSAQVEERDLLAGGDDDDAFQQYLLRTGRVLKADSEALSRSSLSVFEDRTDKALLQERIIASSAADEYDDEYDDSYNDFLSFKVDETAVDIDAGSGRRGGQGGGVQQDVRDRWRREEAERDKRRADDAVKRIEQIAPSRRTDEEKREWERLTHSQPPQQPSNQSSHGSRGRGASVGRGGVGRGGGGRAEPAAVSAALPVTRGRGRGRGAMVAMTSDEREVQRLQRYEQSQQEKTKARSRIYSDDDDDVEEDNADEQQLDGKAEVQYSELPTSSQESTEGAEGGRGGGRGGRGRGGRGWGVGPRGTRGRGGNHNRKALASKKMNNALR